MNNAHALPATPSPPPLLPGNLQSRWLQRFIGENYFYALSAVFMLLGCKLLMTGAKVSVDVGDASEYARTLRTLFILQGYEVLVMITAAAIVLKFGRLGDAFGLLLIEMALLLDPSFFANSFNTLIADSGWTVNVVCFSLVLPKLIFLNHALRLRLSMRTLGALVGAAAVIYLAEIPLALILDRKESASAFLIFSWLAVPLGALMPTIRQVFASDGPSEGFFSESQRARLPRWVLAFPAALFFLHLVESAFVHEVRFRPVYLAPVMIAGAIMMIHHTRAANARKRIVALDGIALVALFFALISQPVFAYPGGVDTGFNLLRWLAECLGGRLHVGLTVGGVALLYAYFAFRLRYRPALYRTGALVLLSGVYVLMSVGFTAWLMAIAKEAGQAGFSSVGHGVQWVWDVLRFMAADAFQFSMSHIPQLLFGVVVVFGTLFAVYRKMVFCYLAVLGSVFWGFSMLEGGTSAWIAEQLQAVGIVVLCFDHFHYRKLSRRTRERVALCIACVALFRFYQVPHLWSGAVVFIEAPLFIVAGIYFTHHGYLAVGILQFLIAGMMAYSAGSYRISMAEGSLGLAAILFASGLIVTFQKTRLLRLISQGSAESSGPGGPGGAEGRVRDEE